MSRQMSRRGRPIVSNDDIQLWLPTHRAPYAALQLRRRGRVQRAALGSWLFIRRRHLGWRLKTLIQRLDHLIEPIAVKAVQRDIACKVGNSQPRGNSGALGYKSHRARLGLFKMRQSWAITNGMPDVLEDEEGLISAIN